MKKDTTYKRWLECSGPERIDFLRARVTGESGGIDHWDNEVLNVNTHVLYPFYYASSTDKYPFKAELLSCDRCGHFSNFFYWVFDNPVSVRLLCSGCKNAKPQLEYHDQKYGQRVPLRLHPSLLGSIAHRNIFWYLFENSHHAYHVKNYPNGITYKDLIDIFHNWNGGFSGWGDGWINFNSARTGRFTVGKIFGKHVVDLTIPKFITHVNEIIEKDKEIDNDFVLLTKAIGVW